MMDESEVKVRVCEHVAEKWAKDSPVEADVLNIKVMQAQREQAEAAKKQANESGPK